MNTNHPPFMPTSVNYFGPNVVNFAGEVVTRYEAKEKARKQWLQLYGRRDFNGCDSYVAGYKLVRVSDGTSVFHPFDSWQHVVCRPSDQMDPSDFIGYRPNPHWLPYANWLNILRTCLREWGFPDGPIILILLHFNWCDMNIEDFLGHLGDEDHFYEGINGID